MLQNGINTILLHRSWNDADDDRVILSRLRRLDGLKEIGTFADKDLLIRVDTELGQPEDISAISVPTLPKDVRPIALDAAAAFPSSFLRPVDMQAKDGLLQLGEGVHFRWLSRIPRGIWKMHLVVAGPDPTFAASHPVTLSVEVEGLEVVSQEDIQVGDVLEGIPVRIGKTAHYRINCLVKPKPAHAPFSLSLKDVRLEPVEIRGRRTETQSRRID